MSDLLDGASFALTDGHQPAPLVTPPTAASTVLARVNDTALTEMPQDLYIPPEALRVFLETFEGPLDLLLYLIRRQNLDILAINVAAITSPTIAAIPPNTNQIITRCRLSLSRLMCMYRGTGCKKRGRSHKDTACRNQRSK